MEDTETEEQSTDIVWPAPGLDRLHGMLNTVRSRAAVSAILLAAPMAWIIAGGSTSDPMLSVALSCIAALALLIYLSAILRVAGIVDLSRKARRLGYSKAIILETIADRARDTMFLMSGTGTYLNVLDRTRARVRRLRLWSAFFATIAAFVPVPLLCIALMLALRGAADPIGFALLLFAPVITLMLAASLTSGYAGVLTHWDRGGDVWDPSPVTEADRAVAWRNLLHEPSVAPKRGGLLSTFVIAAAGIALFVSVAFVVGVTLAYTFTMRQQLSRANYQSIFMGSGEDMIMIELMREWRLPVDTTVPVEVARTRAGNALQSLLSAGSEKTPWLKAPVTRYPAMFPRRVDSWYALAYFVNTASNRRYGIPPRAIATIDSIAAAGPSAALREFDVLASARDIDVTSTRYALPISDQALGHADDYPTSARDAQAAALISAATRLRHGDAAGAELQLRKMLSAGFLLIDSSPFTRDFWAGSGWISSAREALAVLYGHTGRSADSVAITLPRKAIDHFYAASGGMGSAASAGFGALTLSARSDRPQQMNALFGTIRNIEIYPSMRWTAFQAVVPIVRCGNVQTAMFGPDAYSDLLVDNSTHYLTRMPSDSALISVVMHPRPRNPIQLSERPGFRRFQRAVMAVVGDYQWQQPCAGAFSPRF